MLRKGQIRARGDMMEATKYDRDTWKGRDFKLGRCVCERERVSELGESDEGMLCGCEKAGRGCARSGLGA